KDTINMLFFKKLLVILSGALLVPASLGDEKAAGSAEQQRAKALVEKLGGKVEVDEKDPNKPIATVNFLATRITDADLKILSEPLSYLARLQHLHLGVNPITDEGLKHLRTLTGLTDLELVGTMITDAGLTHLKALSNLQRLRLSQTNITDTGLIHL